MSVNRLKDVLRLGPAPSDEATADGSVPSPPPPALRMKAPASFCGLLIRVDDERLQREWYERLRAEGVSCRLVNW